MHFTTALKVTLALVSLLGVDAARSWDGHGRTPEDVIALALTIEGEGAHLFRNKRELAGLMIAHTLMNDRRALTHEPGAIALVAHERFGGYRAYKNRKPHKWALELAEIAIVAHDLDVDKSSGALYIFSADDLATIEIGREEARARALVWIERGRWGLYTFPENDFPFLEAAND